MAEITAAIRKAHGWTADLVPSDIAKSIDQAELLDRVIFAEELGRKSRSATEPTLRKGYSSLARAVMTAQPRAVIERQVSDRIAKAAGLPNTRQADALRREAQEIMERNPPAPRRSDATAVAKAKAGDDSLVVLYDSDGAVIGVCPPSAITAAGDMAAVGKARRPAPPPGRSPVRR